MLRRAIGIVQFLAIVSLASAAMAQTGDAVTNALGAAVNSLINNGSNNANPSYAPDDTPPPYGAMPPNGSYGNNTGYSASHHESGIPHGVPHLARTAAAKARAWHSDAELVIVDVDNNGPGGKSETRFSFYSPSTGEGAWITNGQLMPAGSVNWPTQPISLNFIDLPEAVAQARAMGMRGPVDHSQLMVENQGALWRVVPAEPTDMMSYAINAGGGSPTYAGTQAPSTLGGLIPPATGAAAVPSGGWSDYNRTHSIRGGSGIQWLPPGTPVGVGQDK